MSSQSEFLLNQDVKVPSTTVSGSPIGLLAKGGVGGKGAAPPTAGDESNGGAGGARDGVDIGVAGGVTGFGKFVCSCGVNACVYKSARFVRIPL